MGARLDSGWRLLVAWIPVDHTPSSFARFVKVFRVDCLLYLELRHCNRHCIPSMILCF
jgi:hypothetical protein